MSEDNQPDTRLWNAVVADVTGVTWDDRLITMLLTTGVLAFGVMLGGHLMAADLFFGVELPPLHQRYRLLMDGGMIVAGSTLAVAVGLESRRPQSDGGQADD